MGLFGQLFDYFIGPDIGKFFFRKLPKWLYSKIEPVAPETSNTQELGLTQTALIKPKNGVKGKKKKDKITDLEKAEGSSEVKKTRGRGR